MSEVNGAQLLVGLAIFVISTLASLGLVAAFLVKIPADHFLREHRGVQARLRSEGASLVWKIGKNLLGVVLIVVGALLSVPGIPGQGLLTILVGIMLLDIPGKHRLELRLVRRPRLRRAIDRIRERFGAPPLVLEEEEGGAGSSDDGDAASR